MKQPSTPQEHVTKPEEINAVKSGAITGIVYPDGDVWADIDSLNAWREKQAKQ
jgi:hypothetical protein